MITLSGPNTNPIPLRLEEDPAAIAPGPDIRNRQRVITRRAPTTKIGVGEEAVMQIVHLKNPTNV